MTSTSAQHQIAIAVTMWLVVALSACSPGDPNDLGLYVTADYVPAGFRVERSKDGYLRFVHSDNDPGFTVSYADCERRPSDICGQISGQQISTLNGRQIRTGPAPNTTSHLSTAYVTYVTDGRFTLRVNSAGTDQDEAARIGAGLHVVDREIWRRYAASLNYDPNEIPLGRLSFIHFVLTNDTPTDLKISYCWRPSCDEHLYGFRPVPEGGQLTRDLVPTPNPVGRYVLYAADETTTTRGAPVGCLTLDQSARPGSTAQIHLSNATPCD